MHEACELCCKVMRSGQNPRPIPEDESGERVLPPKALASRRATESATPLPATSEFRGRLHACKPGNCYATVQNEILEISGGGPLRQ